MDSNEKNVIWKRKRMAILFFLCILYIPLIFFGIGSFFDIKLDMTLNGYTENVEKLELTAKTFFSGDYQGTFAQWFDNNFHGKGFLTKMYSTIRYNLFHLGNRTIGKNGDIFDTAYILSDLSMSDAYDLSVDANREKVDGYVRKLEQLQKKLNKVGKHLYVYIAADKVDFHMENVPAAFKALANEQGISPENYLVKALAGTDIRYLDSREVGKHLEYPTFYTTGLHWSRPFEQKVSQAIVENLAELTGKDYRKIQLGEIKESTEPFWRETDVYDQLNVWNRHGLTFHEYTVERQFPETYENLNMLLYGTSFADGLRSDILETYAADNVYYVNRNGYFLIPNGNAWPIGDNWEGLDLKNYLDKIDVVVIEHLSFEILETTYGFVDHLLNILEEYSPAKATEPTMQRYNASQADLLDYNFTNGYHYAEQGFTWVNEESEILLKDPQITENGLRIVFSVPDTIIDNLGEQTVYVYINGQKTMLQVYKEAVEASIVIPPEKLTPSESGEDIYKIGLFCGESFVPADWGINEDTRTLALRITYIGRA